VGRLVRLNWLVVSVSGCYWPRATFNRRCVNEFSAIDNRLLSMRALFTRLRVLQKEFQSLLTVGFHMGRPRHHRVSQSNASQRKRIPGLAPPGLNLHLGNTRRRKQSPVHLYKISSASLLQATLAFFLCCEKLCGFFAPPDFIAH